MSKNILTIDNLSKSYYTKEKEILAIDNISLNIKENTITKNKFDFVDINFSKLGTLSLDDINLSIKNIIVKSIQQKINIAKKFLKISYIKSLTSTYSSLLFPRRYLFIL